MKTLQNDFTTPEQSKRLLELGIPADSADCAVHTANYDNSIVVMSGGYTYSKWIKEVYGCQEVAPYLPCWSVGRLNEIFKICTDIHIEIYDLDFEGTQIERAMQSFEEYAKYNWLDFSKLED